MLLEDFELLDEPQLLIGQEFRRLMSQGVRIFSGPETG